MHAHLIDLMGVSFQRLGLNLTPLASVMQNVHMKSENTRHSYSHRIVCGGFKLAHERREQIIFTISILKVHHRYKRQTISSMHFILHSISSVQTINIDLENKKSTIDYKLVVKLHIVLVIRIKVVNTYSNKMDIED